MTNGKTEGGLMGGVEDLYREVILEHFKSPKNKGKLENACVEVEGMNPLCGDQIVLTANIEGDTVKEIRYTGHGCAISQAAASMMTDLITGKTIKDIKALSVTYKNLFGVEGDGSNETPYTREDLGDAMALEGVKKYPVRIKCALLSWNTLLQCFEENKKKEGQS